MLDSRRYMARACITYASTLSVNIGCFDVFFLVIGCHIRVNVGKRLHVSFTVDV